MKCPKCNFENSPDTRFCGNCGTQIRHSEGASISSTETLPESLKELTEGSLFANRYEVIEKLGMGGMGNVYRVLDKKINEEIALKLLRPEIASDERTITRFKNELKFARKIIHKNVCRMYDISEADGIQYITMEYVPGEDLKKMIKKIGHLPSGKAVYIARQVCEGLAEAHKLGVIHRDLKPQNIMIDKEGKARIMDFGIARSLEAEGVTMSGVIVGTPHYMSPEQVEAKEVDQRSDIYALGIIFFEMLTGSVPFDGNTFIDIAIKHKNTPSPDPRRFNPQLPEKLSRVILKCMEKNKSKRYQTVEELLIKLNDIQKNLPITERVLPEIKFEIRKRRMYRLLKDFTLVSLIIVAGYVFYTRILQNQISKIGKEKEEPKPPAIAEKTTQKGRVEISSIPEGAEVYINDKLEGVTPFKHELSPAAYQIKIKKYPEYEEITDIIDIRAGESNSKNYTLIEKSSYLEINSTPEGAEIYINDNRQGVTPFKRKFAPGTYRLKIIKAPGYEEKTDVLKLIIGDTVIKNYNLVPLYILNITTVPEGAEVSIDEKPIGKTPIKIELSKNICQLKVKKGEEWSSINESITLNPGLNSVQRYLKRIKYPLLIRTDPPGANVYFSGKLIGATPIKISDLSGVYEIKIEKQGYKPIEESIIIESEMEKTYSLIKIELGKIRLKVQPYAIVSIDGKLIGEVPPMRIQEIEEGKHTIEFVSGDKNKKFTIEVEVNEPLMDALKEAMTKMSSALPEIMKHRREEK